MPTHFKTYVANFNRIRLSEMIDFHAERARMQQLKPSLVVHPWTGRFYDAECATACCDLQPRR